MNAVLLMLIGLVVTLSTSAHGEQKKVDYPPLSPTMGTDQRRGCSCGTVEFHNGVDWNAKERTTIPVADAGVVVRVEDKHDAIVYSSTGGYCGRYVVVKHSYPNGRIVYTRYAQLGQIVGKGGQQITVGTHLKSKDFIAEVGKTGLFHFEVRPVLNNTVDRETWATVYARDPGFEWIMYQPVDPGTFDFDKFAGRTPSGQ